MTPGCRKFSTCNSPFFDSVLCIRSDSNAAEKNRRAAMKNTHSKPLDSRGNAVTDVQSRQIPSKSVVQPRIARKAETAAASGSRHRRMICTAAITGISYSKKSRVRRRMLSMRTNSTERSRVGMHIPIRRRTKMRFTENSPPESFWREQRS